MLLCRICSLIVLAAWGTDAWTTLGKDTRLASQLQAIQERRSFMSACVLTTAAAFSSGTLLIPTLPAMGLDDLAMPTVEEQKQLDEVSCETWNVCAPSTDKSCIIIIQPLELDSFAAVTAKCTYAKIPHDPHL
jgi:hypothetical protein